MSGQCVVELTFGNIGLGLVTVWVAMELLQGPKKGGTIGVVICDCGLKNLSTGLWA